MDRETFKALAADSRIEILRALNSRRMTGSELAARAKLSPSTIKEHLDRLQSAGLIEQVDEGRKWKYYCLTQKGRSVISPQRQPSQAVWILLGISIFALAWSTFNLFSLGGIGGSSELAQSAQQSTFADNSAPESSGSVPQLMAAPQPTNAAPVAMNAGGETRSAKAASAPDSAAGAGSIASAASSTPDARAYATSNDAVSEQAAHAQTLAAAESSVLPSPRQAGVIDLALEASLLIIVLGLGYYAFLQKKRAAGN